MVLKYSKLDIERLHTRVYSDGSFASNEDNSSQLRYIILLADKYNNVHVLSYCSKKSKRIVRSIMAGEVFAFSAAFDQADVIRNDLQFILNTAIGLTMNTDSKQLFGVITRVAHTTEKRLMVEIMAAKEACNRHEISNVGLVSRDSNPADGLTKPKICTQLNDLLYRGKDYTKVTQWIYRIEYCSMTNSTFLIHGSVKFYDAVFCKSNAFYFDWLHIGHLCWEIRLRSVCRRKMNKNFEFAVRGNTTRPRSGCHTTPTPAK